MEQLRVVDLAHTMGITSRELIFKLAFDWRQWPAKKTRSISQRCGHHHR